MHFLDRVERKGQGWNLCLQTLDGILCHDGEVHNQVLAPQRDKTFDDLAREMQAKRHRPDTALTPMTLEGCVVRMADTISYIGRDIEDAIRLGLVNREDLPPESTRVLGDTNGTIVFHLVTDILKTSHEQGYVAMSPEVSAALWALKRFNLERIYLNPRMKPHTDAIRDLFRRLFEQYHQDLETGSPDSAIRGFLDGKSPQYASEHQPAEIVRDFIAGMTDHYFMNQCPEHLRPAYIQSG